MIVNGVEGCGRRCVRLLHQSRFNLEGSYTSIGKLGDQRFLIFIEPSVYGMDRWIRGRGMVMVGILDFNLPNTTLLVKITRHLERAVGFLGLLQLISFFLVGMTRARFVTLIGESVLPVSCGGVGNNNGIAMFLGPILGSLV